MTEQEITQAFQSLGFNSEGEDLIRTAETIENFVSAQGAPIKRNGTGARWEKKSRGGRGSVEELYIIDCGDYRLSWCSNEATFR